MAKQQTITGTVKWFNETKGYGFIKSDTDAPDHFVHHTGIQGEGFKTLYEGQKVQFFSEKGEKGLQAVQVVVL